MSFLLIPIIVTLCRVGSIYGCAIHEYPPEFIEYYRQQVYNISLPIFRTAAFRTGFHFADSYPAFWLTLGGMAEGADPYNQQLLLKRLYLPTDRNIREIFYEIAASRMTLSPYVNVDIKRGLMLDENATPFYKWHNYVTEHSLLNVTYGPIKCDPKAAVNKIRKLMSVRFPYLTLRGNSVLYNTIDFNGLWTDAFDKEIVEKAPFYNSKGQRIGSVDLMTTRRRAYIGYLPSIHSKVLALPLGANKEYIMIFGMAYDDTDFKTIFSYMKNTIVLEALEAMKYSDETINIALPQFTMNMEMDTRGMLQDIGIKNLWTDPDASKYVSSPPALPDHYLLRSTVTLDRDGVNPPPKPGPCGCTDSNDGLRNFIANKPFMYGLFDAQTYGGIVIGIFSRPTYTD